MSPSRILPALVLLAVATAALAGDPAKPSSPRRTIADVAWIAGDWQTAPGARQTDERWSPPSGGAMLGTSRTVAGGKMVEFEYLRIMERDGVLAYIAHPGARSPGTVFQLTTLTASRAVFENPEHDFPKRIAYEKLADGSLKAVVDGGEGTEAYTFHYLPLPR